MDTTHEDMSEQQPPAQRKLIRPRQGRMVAGVCAGLAEYTGWDPILFRLGFVGLTLLGGSGILLYLLAALLIPSSDGTRRDASGIGRAILIGLVLLIGLRIVFGFIGAGLGILSVGPVSEFGYRFRDGGFGIGPFELLFGIALIAFGFVLLRDRPDQHRDDQIAQSTSVAAGGAGTVAERVTAATTGGHGGEPRRMSPLAPLTLAAAFVVVGLLTGFSESLGLDVGEIVAAAMIVLATGLIVGAWWGRGRLLLIPALLLIPVMLVTSLIDLPPRGAIGSQYIYVDRVSQLEDSYELLLGEVTIDWSAIPSNEFGHRELDLSMAAGRMSLYLPAHISVDVEGYLNAGEAVVGDGRQDGVRLSLQSSTEGDPDAGSLLVNFQGGVGSLVIERLGNSEAPPGVIDLNPGRPERPNGDRKDKNIQDKRTRNTKEEKGSN